jgi:tripartite-type tricarboxylate transporter receptor subunit TctC
VGAPARLAAFPDVPTLDEVGFTGFRASQWSAAFAPAGVPREIVETLHKAFVAASKTPEMREFFEKGGLAPPQQASVDDARNWLKEEMESWRRDIADVGISLDD